MNLSYCLAVALGMMLGGGIVLILVFLCIGEMLTTNLDIIKELLEIKQQIIKYIEAMQNLRKVKDDQSD